MPYQAHSFLIDLLAAHDSAADFGCGLEPRLLELLVDRHSAPNGVHRLDRPLRSDGPGQKAPEGWTRIGPRDARTSEAAHGRR